MDYIEQETRPWIEQQQDSATAPEVLTLPRLVVDVFMKGMVLTARDALSQTTDLTFVKSHWRTKK